MQKGDMMESWKNWIETNPLGFVITICLILLVCFSTFKYIQTNWEEPKCVEVEDETNHSR